MSQPRARKRHHDAAARTDQVNVRVIVRKKINSNSQSAKLPSDGKRATYKPTFRQKLLLEPTVKLFFFKDVH
jgi:hypothetical protein